MDLLNATALEAQMDDKELVAEARELAEEWFEMCDDIHEPLLRFADRIEALNARLAKAEALAEALRKLERGDIPRPVGSAWFPDGRASKHDRCTHDVWMYEVCEGCQDAFIAAALKAWEEATPPADPR